MFRVQPRIFDSPRRHTNVPYTIDANGKCLAPPDCGSNMKGAPRFFTDSFTFGKGVDDKETFLIPSVCWRTEGNRRHQ
jgi:hypothetical protein